MTSTVLVMDDIRGAAKVIRALNHKLRRAMLELLDQEGKMCVSDIYETLKLEQSVASQHLGILRQAGIVSTERDGKFLLYYIEKNRLEHIKSLAKEMVIK